MTKKCPAPWCGRDLPEGQDHPDHEVAATEIARATAFFVVVAGEGESQDVHRFAMGRAKLYGHPR